jgi:hypothetical protein
VGLFVVTPYDISVPLASAAAARLLKDMLAVELHCLQCSVLTSGAPDPAGQISRSCSGGMRVWTSGGSIHNTILYGSLELLVVAAEMHVAKIYH